MKLCHPMDMGFDRIGSGTILQASCTVAGCANTYARFVKSDQTKAVLAAAYAESDDWAYLRSLRQVIEEMRCRDTDFCYQCRMGHPLNECEGVKP
jgi:hypothetical protein